jgi:hypothetical protein
MEFSEEIDAALMPSLAILTELLCNADNVNAEDAPVLHYSRQPPGNGPEATIRMSGMIPFHGDVSILDRARATNWFELHVPDARAKRHLWIGKVPLAHAITVLLAYRLHSKFCRDPDFPATGSAIDQERWLLKKAWEYQKEVVRVDLMDVDVDMESLKLLEGRMFEVSKEAGRAGYYQWGLDVGDHQDKWFPYEHVVNHRDGEFDEEVEVCLFVIC